LYNNKFIGKSGKKKKEFIGELKCGYNRKRMWKNTFS
jgi:hypothetical protein